MKLFTIPNMLTFIRLILTFVIVYFIFAGKYIFALILFVISFFTEFDGTVARALHQETKFGEYFDSITDFIWLGGILLAFTIVGSSPLWLLLSLALVGALILAIIVVPSLKSKKKSDISFRGNVDFIFGGLFILYLIALFLEFIYFDIVGVLAVIAMVVVAGCHLRKLYF